jgi:tripartite ATP-independent transporter DctM subunit
MKMAPELLGLLMILSLLLLVVMGAPIAFTLASMGVIFGAFGIGLSILPLYINRIYGLMNNQVLPAIPLFIFMGFMLESCGVTEKLYDSLHGLLGGVRGGLALANVIICTLFAACTGVIAASIVTMGIIGLPSMLKRGYNKGLATGSILAGGTLGVIIPPSIVIILYGTISTLSVAKLFAAAMIPGLMLSSIYFIYIIIRCWIDPDYGPSMKAEERAEISAIEILKDVCLYALPTILLIVLVLGSIIFGIVAITEAAAVGAFGSVILSIVYKKFTWDNYKKASLVTLKTTSMVLFIAIGASLLSVTLIRLGSTKFLADFILNVPSFVPSALSKWFIIFEMMAIVFILGMFIDWIGILFIIIPMFTPVVLSLGFSPIWFAVIVNMNLQMAFLTPPFAYSMFFLKSVAPKEVTMSDIYRGAFPFVLLQLIGLILTIALPKLSLWLPSILF